MDTEQNQTNAPDDHGETPDPLDELELTDDLDVEIDEVDDTAILNELLRDLSPDLVDEDAAADKPAESAPAAPQEPEVQAEPEVAEPEPASVEEPAPEPVVEPTPQPAPAAEEKPSSEGSWLFDDALEVEASVELAVEPETPVETEEEPAVEETATEAPVEAQPEPKAAPVTSSEDSGSWLFDDSLEEEVAAVQDAVVDAPEPEVVADPEPEAAESTAEAEDTFSSQTLDEAFAALDSPDEQSDVPVAQEAPADDSGGGLFDEAALDGAFDGLEQSGDADVAEAAEETSGEADVGMLETVAEELVTEIEDVPAEAQVADSADAPDAVIGGLSSAVAEHLLARLAPSLGMLAPTPPSAPTPPPAPPEPEAALPVEEVAGDVSEEPALTADIEDDFFVAAEEGEAVQVAGEPDVADLLTQDLAAIEEDSEAAAADPSPSLDDLITSAVLEPESVEEVPDFSELEGEEVPDEEAVGQEAPPIVSAEADDELDQLIRDMKARQKKRRITMAAVAGVAVVAIALLTLRDPAPDDADLASVPSATEQPVGTDIESDDIAAPQPETDTSQPTETPEPEPEPTPVEPTPAPAREPARSGREQLAAAIGGPPPAPTPTPTPTQPPRVADASPTRPPADPRGAYTVHVESHATTVGSEQGRAKWSRRGFDHVLVWTWVNSADGRQWYRLGVGRYSDRQTASAAKEYLKSEYPSEIDWSPVTRIPEGAR